MSPDGRTVTKEGGREGDVFYRDRWSHDKVVRSTHGVNCTGSCSWKVYVKDGVITWETQETDYPTVGPDRPEYEPRGCPRGAAFSWYTYSPTRVRYPYARGVLVEMFREAKQRLGDPVLAWADIQSDRARRRRYQQARGKGGLVRVTWAEATEMIAAAHVHTIKEYGPDRVAGLLADPGDVDGVARGRLAVHRADRRRDDVVLRLVRRPARRLAAGLRRPDRRARVGGLVGRVVPARVGLERPGHPHPRRALDGRGPLPRRQGRHGQPGLRRQHEVRRRVDGLCRRHGRGAGDGHGPRHPQGVLRRPAGAVLRRLRAAVHRPAVPGEAGGAPRRGLHPGHQPDGGRPRRHRRGRGPQDGPARRAQRRAGGAQRLARLPLHRLRHGQVEPRPRGRRPDADGGGRRLRGRRGRPAALRLRRRLRGGAAARACPRAGSADTWSRPCST